MNKTTAKNNLLYNFTNLPALSLAALGIVFGDIGTSPLYALRECFHGSRGIMVTEANVLGLLSLISWSLFLIISVKYLLFVLHADNRGEGGILALMTLVTRDKKIASRRLMAFVSIGLFGAALLYADGVITPAISVMSAVEGLNVATNFFNPYIVPISLAILVSLFFVQRWGTAKVGAVFGPVMLIWFSTLAILGIHSISHNPHVLIALNPAWGINFFIINKWLGFGVLGTVFLAVTGGEVLYADLGHFGYKPIQLAWFYLVFPALILNYFGQGALLLRYPHLTDNLFFRLAPTMLYPLVALATISTVIASQAVISGAFSLARQAIQLGYWPRLEIIHTSSKKIGQVYVPLINWGLMLGIILIIIIFKESGKLAEAYGSAVSATMLITTILTAIVAWKLWRISLWLVIPVATFFFVIDSAYFISNIIKFKTGAWIIILIAGGVYLLMSIWRKGRDLLWHSLTEKSVSVKEFLCDIKKHNPIRVPGTAVFLTGNASGVPKALLHNFEHNKILHEQTILFTVITEEIPYVSEQEKFTFIDKTNGLYQIIAKYGFSEDPNIPHVLENLKIKALKFNPKTTTYFLGKETLIIGKNPGMPLWQKRIFKFMSLNKLDATLFFHIPTDKVIELGLQMEL